MNYQRIHDAIISKARQRQYVRKEHHLHHVIPKHEQSDSTDVVPLTIREHHLIHRLRFKITGTLGNYLAWKLLSKSTSDPQRLIQSIAGMIGGCVTKSKERGIFSKTYDRAKQSILNWENGIGLSGIENSQRILNCSNAGKSTRAKSSGIFREDLQHLRSSWAKLGRSSQSTPNGICSLDWRNLNPERVVENASKGGRIGGKITGSMYWWNNGNINKKSSECPGDDWVRGMLMSEKKRQQVLAIAGHNKKNKTQ